jgi:hypothetical protein
MRRSHCGKGRSILLRWRAFLVISGSLRCSIVDLLINPLGLERVGPVFSQLYGQTECYPISGLRSEALDRRRDRGRRRRKLPLFIVDRLKDAIISGGFNVYSREVEDTLASHPAVVAVVVVKADDPVSERQLIEHARRLKGPVQSLRARGAGAGQGGS